jgi:hypothetical protein
MATAALGSAAIGTVTEGGGRWQGRRRGNRSPERELDTGQIRADTGRRQRGRRRPAHSHAGPARRRY